MTRTDVPDELRQGFWRIVFLLNVGPIALTIAIMVALFGGLYEVAAVGFVVGSAALLRAFQLYNRYSNEYL